MSTRRGTVSDEDTEFMKQLDESFASINDSSARLANLICCEEIPIDSRALRCLEAQLKSISNTIKLVKAGMKILPSPSCEIQKPIIRNPEPSPFLRLPGELRNLIYSYVFCDLKLVVHGSKCYKVIPCANNSPATKAAFRLPEVCRLFYFETYLLLPQTATIIYRVNYGTMRKNYVMEGKEATVLPRRQVSAITSVVPNPPTVSIDMSRLFPGLKQIVMSKEMYAENGLIWWNVSHYGMMSGQWARQVHCSWHEKECIMNMLGDAATEDIEVKDCYRTLGKRPTKGESVYERLCKGKDGRGMASKSDCTFTI